MKVYLYTPLHNNNKIIPHLLEHCTTWQGMTENEYFKYFWYLDETCRDKFTGYENITNLDIFWEIIKRIPDKETIRYELNQIKQEKKNKSYSIYLSNKIGKHLYGPSYKSNTTTIPSYKQVYEYHKKYYQNPSYILADDDNKIIKIHNIKRKKTKKSSKLKRTFFSNRRSKETILYKEIKDVVDVYHIYFITELYASFIIFYNRFQKGKYNYDNVYYYTMSNHMAVSINNINELPITETFFQEFKKAFIKDLNHKSSNIWQIFAVFYLGRKVDLDIIKEYYEKLKYQDFTFT